MIGLKNLKINRNKFLTNSELNKKIMKKLIILLFIVFNSYGQETINTGGGNIDNRISYSIGQNLTNVQIPVIEEDSVIVVPPISLGVPKFEIPEIPKKQQTIKKKTFLQNLIEFITSIFKKQK